MKSPLKENEQSVFPTSDFFYHSLRLAPFDEKNVPWIFRLKNAFMCQMTKYNPAHALMDYSHLDYRHLNYEAIWTTPNWTTSSFGLLKFGIHPK